MKNKELKALDDLFDLVTCQGSFEEGQKCYNIIEETLTTKSEKEQALEIIVKKDVDVEYLKWVERETYNLHFKDKKEKHLTEKEYDLVSKVVEEIEDEKMVCTCSNLR